MSSAPLGKRAALVTGAGRGIGAAVARALSAAGASILVTSRTLAEVEAVAEELRGRGGAAHAAASDVTDELSVQALGAFARLWAALRPALLHREATEPRIWRT